MGVKFIPGIYHINHTVMKNMNGSGFQRKYSGVSGSRRGRTCFASAPYVCCLAQKLTIWIYFIFEIDVYTDRGCCMEVFTFQLWGNIRRNDEKRAQVVQVQGAANIWARLKIFAVDIWATALVVIWATNFNGHLYFQVDVWANGFHRLKELTCKIVSLPGHMICTYSILAWPSNNQHGGNVNWNKQRSKKYSMRWLPLPSWCWIEIWGNSMEMYFKGMQS